MKKIKYMDHFRKIFFAMQYVENKPSDAIVRLPTVAFCNARSVYPIDHWLTAL
jgi:hypothetical protein